MSNPTNPTVEDTGDLFAGMKKKKKSKKVVFDEDLEGVAPAASESPVESAPAPASEEPPAAADDALDFSDLKKKKKKKTIKLDDEDDEGAAAAPLDKSKATVDSFGNAIVEDAPAAKETVEVDDLDEFADLKVSFVSDL
jgi:translation initiation factor 2 subunit 2